MASRAAARNMSYTFMASYLTYFFVNVFGIDPAIVATMLFIEGIWDAVNDPIMGSIVDKTRTRFGKLRPYLLVIPIPLAVVTMLLFAGPVLMAEATMGAKVVYMVITYFVWEFLYTICDVPFWGMSAAISPNPADRTRAISSARFTASILGGLPGIVLPVLIDLINAGAGQCFPAKGFLCDRHCGFLCRHGPVQPGGNLHARACGAVSGRA